MPKEDREMEESMFSEKQGEALYWLAVIIFLVICFILGFWVGATYWR
jgi:hypothetical protein